MGHSTVEVIQMANKYDKALNMVSHQANANQSRCVQQNVTKMKRLTLLSIDKDTE